MGTLISLACVAVAHTKDTYSRKNKQSHMPFAWNSDMHKFIAFFFVLYSPYMAFALECPEGQYYATDLSTEFPTTDVVVPRYPNGGYKTGSQLANYVETWSDNGYTVRAKANVAQWFGVNAGLFDGFNLDTGSPYFYTFDVFNSGGAFSDADFKFQISNYKCGYS